MDLSKLSKYLKSDMVKDGDKVKFITAGAMVEKDNPFKPGEKKMNFEIVVEVNGEEKLATLNFTSQKELTKVFGSKTEAWLGKTAKVQKIKQNVAGKIKDVVYIIPEEAEINLEG